ncbi:MAG: flagellar basal body rod protein FlgF [Gammaproteobacteria bacterium]
MDKLLYIAMNGASETMKAQAVNSQNLANVSTTGFRADLESYASQPVYGPGHASRVYGLATDKGVDFTPGSAIGTGRDLDIAVNGRGWIAVQGPDGNEAYTRAGDLQVDSLGLLTTGAGHPVIGSGSPIAIPPFEKIEIAADGTISILPVGQGATALQVVDRIKLVNPPEGDMVKGSDSLMHMANYQPAIADSTVTLQPGAIESSNVNAIEAMVSLIQLARHYEMQIKVMASAEENDKASSSLMRMG